jgi:hypothetical protein
VPLHNRKTRQGHTAGKVAAKEAAALAQHYTSMHVSYSPGGEYTEAIDQTEDANPHVTTKQTLARTLAHSRETS